MANRLKVIMKPMVNGSLTPLLCDMDGNPLPGQTRVDIHTAVDDIARVTVEFVAVEFADDGRGGSNL
jgi:hypothetical protein